MHALCQRLSFWIPEQIVGGNEPTCSPVGLRNPGNGNRALFHNMIAFHLLSSRPPELRIPHFYVTFVRAKMVGFTFTYTGNHRSHIAVQPLLGYPGWEVHMAHSNELFAGLQRRCFRANDRLLSARFAKEQSDCRNVSICGNRFSRPCQLGGTVLSMACVPLFVEPMAALNTAKLPEGDSWLYEVKWDGYRALAVKERSGVHLLSRKGNNLTRDYPEVAEAVAGIRAKTALLDGEILALDDQGRPSFQMLQHGATLGKNRRVVYYAFDLLNLNGRDLRSLPLEERKKRLAEIVAGSDVLLSPNLDGRTEILIEQVAKLKLEGIIAKRRDSIYEAGKRSGAWQKFKVNNEQEFVIGGYRPDGKNFVALLVG